MKKSINESGVKEIARRANVSIATVDRVIHNRTGVSLKTRNKIVQIIEELNYQPNLLASRLASRKVFTLGILIPGVSAETVFWEAPLKGVQRAAAEIKQYGFITETYFFDLNDKNSFKKQASLMLDTKIDGVLLSPSFLEESIEVASSCKSLAIPYVFIDSNIPDQENLCYIGPHLFKSGYVGAKLFTYAITKQSKVLVVNISKEIDNYNYLQIEEGFRTYFTDHSHENTIVRADIRQTDYPSIANTLTQVLNTHQDIEAIFVTNSRVFSVANFLETRKENKIMLIGYDYLEDNIEHLKKGTIHFLICHKPEEQGYRGIMALYQRLLVASPVEKEYYMPIDIIMKENYEFYRN